MTPSSFSSGIFPIYSIPLTSGYQRFNFGTLPDFILVLHPRLRDTMSNASQEAETARRPEDVAVDESVREVMAQARAQRPRNTTRNYLPKQKEWRAGFPCRFFPFSPLLTCGTFTGVVPENGFQARRKISAL
jgi:hypothetical protein